jgi:hypothetical protein
MSSPYCCTKKILYSKVETGIKPVLYALVLVKSMGRSLNEFTKWFYRIATKSRNFRCVNKAYANRVHFFVHNFSFVRVVTRTELLSGRPDRPDRTGRPDRGRPSDRKTGQEVILEIRYPRFR